MAASFPRQQKSRPDPEDLQEAPETPGETPDAEDIAEGPEMPDEATASADAAGAADQGGDDQPNVSPEEQKMYDTVVVAGLHQIFDEKMIGIITDKLKAGQSNISGAIGHTATMIMRSVDTSVQNQGKQIPDDVMFAAGQEIVSALVEVAISAKLMNEKQKDAVTEAAMYEGMRVWGDTMQKAHGISPDVQGQAKQDLQDAGIQQQEPQGGASAPPDAAPPPTGIVNSGTAPQPGAPQ